MVTLTVTLCYSVRLWSRQTGLWFEILVFETKRCSSTINEGEKKWQHRTNMSRAQFILKVLSSSTNAEFYILRYILSEERKLHELLMQIWNKPLSNNWLIDNTKQTQRTSFHVLMTAALNAIMWPGCSNSVDYEPLGNRDAVLVPFSWLAGIKHHRRLSHGGPSRAKLP